MTIFIAGAAVGTAGAAPVRRMSSWSWVLQLPIIACAAAARPAVDSRRFTVVTSNDGGPRKAIAGRGAL
jgi:hypothetical protein